MAAQASQSAQAGAHASSTSIPISSGGQYVKASAPPALRKTADGSVVGKTTSHGEKPVFCFDPLVKPGVLCLRVPTADDLSAGGQSFISRVLTTYLRTSQEGIPIHWLLVINQSELATFQRRFVELREPAEAVTIEIKVADTFAARLQNPRYSVDKWPVLQMMEKSESNTPVQAAPALGSVVRARGLHVYCCAGTEKLDGLIRLTLKNVNLKLWGKLCEHNRKDTCKAYVHIDEAGQPRYWVLVNGTYATTFEGVKNRFSHIILVRP